MQLHPNDLRLVLSRIPKDISTLLRDHNLCLGGGFIRETIAGNKPNDIDLFGSDADNLQLVGKLLAEKREGRYFSTDNAVTVLSNGRMPVQLITRWLFKHPQEVIHSFDFTVCQAAVWFENGEWQSHIAEDFYRDLAARRLTYTHPQRNEDAGGSLLRVRKFLQRGYNIQVQSLAGVVARLAMGIEPTKITSDEKGMTAVITGLLREVDPLTVVDGMEVPEDEGVDQT